MPKQHDGRRAEAAVAAEVPPCDVQRSDEWMILTLEIHRTNNINRILMKKREGKKDRKDKLSDKRR